ncbi:hypothetical protein [Streptomyces sp. NPDC008001]
MARHSSAEAPPARPDQPVAGIPQVSADRFEGSTNMPDAVPGSNPPD